MQSKAAGNANEVAPLSIGGLALSWLLVAAVFAWHQWRVRGVPRQFLGG
jgi:hypothetical protein